MDKQNYPIVLFDGVCNLCNASVKFLIKIDKAAKLRYAPLQSDNAGEMLKDYQPYSNTPDSIVFIYDGKVYYKSTAALYIAKCVGGCWRYLYYLKFIPQKIRDFIYDLIAANRYNLFGKRDRCMIPDENIRNLFL